jgi:thiopeptide-type bacteriocin biosynthesis protein
MLNTYKFLPQLMLRNPSYSHQDYSLSNLDSILMDDIFKMAIYLASPEFYQRITEKESSKNSLTEKEQTTLAKYYNRMSYRCTPFGNFASISLISWGEKEPYLRLSSLNQARLAVLIDQFAVVQIIPELMAPAYKEYLYSKNATLYLSGNEYHYIGIKRGNQTGTVTYQMDALKADRHLKTFLKWLGANPNVTQDRLVGKLIELTNCNVEEAIAYINVLVDAQIIRTNIEKSVIGNDKLIACCNDSSLPSTPLRMQLKQLLSHCSEIRPYDISKLQYISRGISKTVAGLPITPPKNWFYTGLVRQATGMLDGKFQQPLKEAIDCLVKLVPIRHLTELQAFSAKFKKRYDREKIPLLQALDPEVGIGYGTVDVVGRTNNLWQDIPPEKAIDDITAMTWSKTHQLLLRKWHHTGTLLSGIELHRADLEELDETFNNTLPPSIQIIFNVVHDQICIEAAGGASAIGLIGRFTLFNDETYSLAKLLAAHEQSANPGIIFGEVSHVCDSHVDNINRRLRLYDWELAITTVPDSEDEQQLQLSDLWISMVDDELILESKRLKKRVIPRISSAYNAQNNQLGLFRFMADLQHAGIRSDITFDLESFFPGLYYYPRVTFEQTILSPAKWRINEAQLVQLHRTGNKIKWISDLRDSVGLPKFIALIRSDQQLIFNLEEPSEVLFFLKCIGTDKKSITIREYFGTQQKLIYNDQGKAMTAQIVAFLVSSEPSYQPLKTIVNKMKPKVMRKFILGSQWLYLKIYCASHRSNELLTDEILPVLKKYSNQIISWFFIRYVDTATHIRLRIKINSEHYNEVVLQLKKEFSSYVDYQIIQDYQADVYNRELERYGADIIENVEYLFEKSSMLVLHYLKISQQPEFIYTYHSLAFKSIRYILTVLIPNLDHQIEFVSQMSTLFFKEFKRVENLKFILDKKYRSLKDEIAYLDTASPDYYSSLKLMAFQKRFAKSLDIIVNLSVNFKQQRKDQLSADIIHMHVNRIFPDKQRMQELVIYYCLHKYLRSVKARMEP